MIAVGMVGVEFVCEGGRGYKLHENDLRPKIRMSVQNRGPSTATRKKKTIN